MPSSLSVAILALMACLLPITTAFAQQCVASAGIRPKLDHQATASVTVNVQGCQRSRGRFVLAMQLESMGGTVDFSERVQDWHFEGSGTGHFIYVLDQPRSSAVTDAWVKRDIQCTCLE